MKPCIYMVDDEPDFQIIVRSWLEPRYDVVTLKDAYDLFAALRDRIPDLIILDLHLIGTDGFEACRRLRSKPGLETVPVLFLTASRETEDYQRSMNAGSSGYLMKPVGRRQLLASVADMLAEGLIAGEYALDSGGGD